MVMVVVVVVAAAAVAAAAVVVVVVAAAVIAAAVAAAAAAAAVVVTGGRARDGAGARPFGPPDIYHHHCCAASTISPTIEHHRHQLHVYVHQPKPTCTRAHRTGHAEPTTHPSTHPRLTVRREHAAAVADDGPEKRERFQQRRRVERLCHRRGVAVRHREARRLEAERDHGRQHRLQHRALPRAPRAEVEPPQHERHLPTRLPWHSCCRRKGGAAAAKEVRWW
jgi:hypothetical protein